MQLLEKRELTVMVPSSLYYGREGQEPFEERLEKVFHDSLPVWCAPSVQHVSVIKLCHKYLSETHLIVHVTVYCMRDLPVDAHLLTQAVEDHDWYSEPDDS